MARRSAGNLIVGTAIRGVVYYVVWRSMQRIWSSKHPVLFSAILLGILVLLYYAVT